MPLFYILYLHVHPVKGLNNSGKLELCSSSPRPHRRQRRHSRLVHSPSITLCHNRLNLDSGRKTTYYGWLWNLIMVGCTFKRAGEHISLYAAVENVSGFRHIVPSSNQSEEQLCRGSSLQRHTDDEVSNVRTLALLCHLHRGLQAFHRLQQTQLQARGHWVGSHPVRGTQSQVVAAMSQLLYRTDIQCDVVGCNPSVHRGVYNQVVIMLDCVGNICTWWKQREWTRFLYYHMHTVIYQKQIAPTVSDRLTSLSHKLDMNRFAIERIAFSAICWHVPAKAPDYTKLSDRLLNGDGSLSCDVPVACGALDTDCKNTRMGESVHHCGLHPTSDRLNGVNNLNNVALNWYFVVKTQHLAHFTGL